MAKTSMNLEENIAGVLCYLIFWITGIIFLILEKKNKTVRFHALQSILTFIPLWIIAWIIGWLGAPKWTYGYGPYGIGGFDAGIPALSYLSWIIWIISIILWLILMLKTYQGEKFKLPIIGDIAEKNA
jgi:uncharacterized membrane protein